MSRNEIENKEYITNMAKELFPDDLPAQLLFYQLILSQEEKGLENGEN